jgi:folate-binding protein YgfZ
MSNNEPSDSFHAEYAAVRDGGAGLLDLSSRGRTLVSGSEAVMFLNGLVTNDMKTLGKNSWMPAVFPNVQGRLLAAVRIIHRGDGFLIDTESETHETVVNLLQRFTLAGDFHVTDLTSRTALLSVQGKSAAKVIGATFEDPVMDVEREKVTNVKFNGDKEVTLIRATHTAENGFDLFVEADHAEELRQALTKSGAMPISDGVMETLRIEAGIPRYGIDMDDTTVVTETNLDDAVSFTKGCYVGQEIIVRIKHRGHVAKKLTGVIFEQPARLEKGARILSDDGKEIGRVTSSTFSPRLDRAIALGYVKYDFRAPLTNVSVVANDGEIPAKVAELPFVHGSWYAD